MSELAHEQKIATCIGCGCNDSHACLSPQTNEPCTWLRVDRERQLGVCSECEEKLVAWDNGQYC